MAEEVLIRVEGVSKKFCRDLHTSLRYGLVDLGREIVGKPRTQDLRPKEFWAVRDVSFELKRGESLGLIGRNGAGKTTLLRMLNGLIKPDHGRIELRGRIGALIALGAGFNPLLTGRENIYINGSVLGLKRAEIKSRIDDIVSFAEVEDFIDSPVGSYSSGMNVRLGFAVATAMDPDVLILDEVLAVGDAAFRSKCYRRIAEMRKEAAVIFVSHNMEQVARVCDISLVLSKGRTVLLGPVADGVLAYERINDQGGDTEPSFLRLNDLVRSFEVDGADVEVKSGTGLKLQFHINTKARLDGFILRILFYSPDGAIVADCNFHSDVSGISLLPGENQWVLELRSLPLKNGNYRIGIGVIDQTGDLVVWSYKEHGLRVVGAYHGAVAVCQLELLQWERMN